MRTCTTMVFTDGRNRRFAVMRGRMRGRLFDAHSAEVLATYADVAPTNLSFTASVEALRRVERAYTATHATKDAPAVYWQRAL
jgi:hypothetical protein